ncbi:PAS domain-containing protein [Aureimonas leprariae]|uniref:PAS fold-3 domain-containing protein n=1 Tax=Plantimonas leprariae TaxID=2615207 RepID=A0A7V7PME4_9HYPH|nr:hypothetical protein [Aureimonas leprariae]KAB0678079.1 hypothetical protein F6X38_16775 [Aureimonas leprariae]
MHLAFESCPSSGLYVWDVADDRVVSCATTASLFGLCPDAAGRGLPIATFFDLIHPDDRIRMRQATLGGNEGVYRYQYRIKREANDEIAVRTVGWRFAAEDGACSRHVGTIAALDAAPIGTTIDIVDHCLAAYQKAQTSDKRFVQYLLGMVLMELGYDIAKGR